MGGMSGSDIPVPEPRLRDLARNASKFLPNFAEEDSSIGVKQLHAILGPVLDTADLPDLAPGHRAAATNAACAIIEFCQASASPYAGKAILEDSIWLRMFNIYLQRSENAKGKSMRQILLVLTAIIAKSESPQAVQLRKRSATTLLEIICGRQDRIKVKPALQGLAHFLLRDLVSIAELVEILEQIPKRSSATKGLTESAQTLFVTFLTWVVHHDTALSAGHLVKNFLVQARRSPNYTTTAYHEGVAPLWIVPVVQTLADWPDRIQEFKTHVFPHCFLPNIEEYMRVLSYLHFSEHVQSAGKLPKALCDFEKLDNQLDSSQEFRILLAAIEAGKELTIIRDNESTNSSAVQVCDGALYLPDTVFGSWMSYTEPDVRLAGMFLSIYSTSITRPLTRGVLQSLKRHLVHLHTDTDVNFRSEVNGYTQKLFDRLRASTATLAKSSMKAGGIKTSRLPMPRACYNPASKKSREDPLIAHLAFIVWYLHFLECELRPTASYQRRITALQSLMIVLRSGIDPSIPQSYLSKSAHGQLNWAHGITVATPHLIRVLTDLILDPFDDIRNSAVAVLQLCLLNKSLSGKNDVPAPISRFVKRAESLQVRTGRADQADGVARAYSLLISESNESVDASNSAAVASNYRMFDYLTDQLSSTIDYAYKELAKAVNGRPIHGIFAALRYILDCDGFYKSLSSTSDNALRAWKDTHEKTLSMIEAFWVAVQHILCADAPEGLVPEDMDDDSSMDTKEILSYSWRGLKEASVLLRVIISNAPIGDDERSIISPTLFERLGRLCFTQLLELRHRGAFSTVSQTFAAFCRRCVSSDIKSLRALPEIWYQETLQSIQAKAGAITRRSAGIPALMASILAADPSQLFPRAMNDLVAEATLEAQSANIEESRLPQVHALNCIKEFFTTSRLNVASEAYIGQGLELAARTLNSNIWPIRNCSLMLFKALIERLLGSSESQDWKEQNRAKTSRFSYDDYPTLVGILSALLNPEGPLKQSIEATPESTSPFDLHGAEGVFPALQILRQARPPEASLEPILASVEKLLASPHWHLRDMAARTVVALRSADQLFDAIFGVFRAGYGSHNLQHGTLLAVKHMTRKLLHNANDLSTVNFAVLMQELTNISEQWYVTSRCPFIRAAFLDIVSTCGVAMLRRPDALSILPAWQTLAEAVSIGPQYALRIKRSSSSALLRQSLAQLFFIDRVILRNDCLGQMVNKDYQTIGDALLLFATKDQDTCCAALDILGEILDLTPSNDLTIPLDLVLAHIHRLLPHATDAEVLSRAQAVLASSLTHPHFKTSFFALLPDHQVFDTLTHLGNQCLTAPPSNTQSALQLLGSFLNHTYSTSPSQRREILHATARYIRLIRMAIVDSNPFDTRIAAASSVASLTHIWTLNPASKATGPLLLALSLICYDLLNDDDSDIRHIAALASTKLLRAQGKPGLKDAVPLLTSHRLANFMATSFPRSRDLVTESLHRLTGGLSVPFTATLKQARKEDTSLFAKEKQNLYADTSLDAISFSRILLHTPIPHPLLHTLTTWVQSALAHLTSTAHSEPDGALGWTSKSDVFALGMRVFSAAEVVLKWGEAGKRVDVLQALSVFLDVGREKEVHGLWLGRVERVLEKEVVRMMRGVMGSIAGIEK